MNILKKIFYKLKETNRKGRYWIGIDGLINMETSALITIFLMMFLDIYTSMIFAAFLVIGKCFLDKNKTPESSEMHDFICAIIGVLIGGILGAASSASHLINFF